jgi:sorbitol-6-phosphate 2-dehydrogenase
MQESYLIIAPQIRGLAARSGHRVQVHFEAGEFPADGADPSRLLRLELPASAAGESGEALAASVAGALTRAWEARSPHSGIPSVVQVAGLGSFSIQVEGSAASDSRADVIRGKIAVVTGGAQGFGEEITRGLISNGAFVVVADLNLAGAEKLVTELNREAGKAVSFAAAVNVSNEESVAEMVNAVVAEVGGIDLFVANAGVLKAMPVLEQDLKSFEFVTAVNYTGYMLCAKHAARVMREQNRTNPGCWSDIIQINSKSGLEGSNKNGSYAGSKFGGIGLTQSFAMELVAYGIKVNSICPGNFFDGPLWSDPEKGLFVQYLRTGKVKGAQSIADVKAFYEAKVPMNRGCTGPDVLKALLYIVEQQYETGQAVPVTGGQVMLS